MSEPTDIDLDHGVSSTSSLETAKDIVAGAAGGIAQVLIGKFCPGRSRPRTNASGP